MVSPLNWRRRNFAAIAGESAATYDPSPSVAASIVVPDLELVGWTPFAVSRALGLVSREAFDCVITSSPPQSCHLVGLALKRRGLPWVADFRDGWTYEPTRRPFPTSWQRRLDSIIESRVARQADVLVGVTEPISDDLRDRFGGEVMTITNGFDPDEPVASGDAWAPPIRKERFSVAYTGSLGFGGNSPEPLFAAIRSLKESHPELAARLEVVFAGPSTREEQSSWRDLDGCVSSVGYLPRDRVLALQRAADALVLFTGDDRPSVATGKLYEYLASGRPIIVVGDRSAAASIVRDEGAGVTVGASDIPALAEVLAGAVTGNLGRSQTPDEWYSYPRVAGRMEQAVEKAISVAAR